MEKYIKLLCIIIIILCCTSLWAKDFGLVLDQNLGYGGFGDDSSFEYTGILIPRFTALLGDSGGLYISAGVNLQNDPLVAVPELLRTEAYWRFNNAELKIGRMQYSDPLGYIANGLFDGARFSIDTKAGIFSAGAWYTGLLYKKRINITMTEEELQSSYNSLEYSDFFDTYFASKRIVAALGWEHPALGDLLHINFSLLGQYDFSGADLHSQYAAVKISMPLGNFNFSLGGCVELIENSGDDSSDDFGIGLAGELGAAWMLPTPIEDRLSLSGRFSSGMFENSSIVSFLPITTNSQGSLLKAKLSSLSMITLDYIGRFHRTFSVDVSSSYFIRSDLNTYTRFGNDGYFLGIDFFGRLIWSPASDIQLNLGGGVFLPSLGNAAPDTDALWRIELSVILSLY